MILGALDQEKLFVISDTHFGHKAILEYSDRPFKDLDHHNTTLVKRWNETVPEDAIVLHLGDFAMSLLNEENVLKYGPLNGARKILVAGNHDEKLRLRGLDKLHFHETYDCVRFETGRRSVIASHYPFEVWREDFHIHGHTHGEKAEHIKPGRMDVGVDAWPLAVRDYAPKSWAQVLARFKARDRK